MGSPSSEVIKSTQVMFKWALERLNQLQYNEKERIALYDEYKELIQNYYGYSKIENILYIEYLNNNNSI